MRTIQLLATLTAVALSGGVAHGQTVVWDQGPGTGIPSSNSWGNVTSSQNFADNVKFGTNTMVGGINYFTDFALSNFDAAQTFHIKILADSNGVPGSVLWAWDQAYSSTANLGANLNMLSFQFGPKLFAAGTTYWVGVSGNGFEAAQLSILSPQDGLMAQFDGSIYSDMTSVGDQMFQLTTAVPEPETYAMMMVGLGLLGAVARRRRPRP